jgi:putative hydrolase of the HAD superfamily
MLGPANRSDVALVADADNTLWDTDRVYAEAHLGLLSALERELGVACAAQDRLAFVRSVDQQIAAGHHLGLKYPHQLLVQALAKVLGGAAVVPAIREAVLSPPKDQVARRIETLAARFEEAIRGTPELRPGVAAGLESMHKAGIQIVIATESSSDRCRSITNRWGLARFIDNIVSAPKTQELFLRIARRLQIQPTNCFVVGDQLDRDIAPAVEAGFTGIYFPGGFKPRWAPEIEHVRPAYVISSFDEVPGIIDQVTADRALSR